MKARHAVHLLLIVTSSIAFGQTNPVPLINQPLVPDVVAPGGAGFTLTVNGTGFVASSAVNWNGSARTTTFVSGSELTASILASDIANFNTASVTVVNPGPGGGPSNAAFLEVKTPTSVISLNKSDYPVGSLPHSLTSADFNSDGKLDLAIGNTASNDVSILLGNGDGTFQLLGPYGTGDYPYSVAVGDFNGDGKLDLVVANQLSDNVSVLLGNGDGTFQTATNFGAGSFPTSVAVGDFNGDGKLDLVTANFTPNGSGTVSVLLGRGDGSFLPHVEYGTGEKPNSVGVGDFNGDGKLDLVVVSQCGTDPSCLSSGTVSILLGEGNGAFQEHVDYATGNQPQSVAIGDFNGDRQLDLAVANVNSGTVSVLLGNGDGTFQTHVDYITGVGQSYPDSVTLADLNRDDNLDLAVVNQANNTVGILFGNRDGTFQPATPYGTGQSPSVVVPGDFNDDGELDLGVVNVTDGSVSVLLQGTTFILSTTSLNFGGHVVGTQSPAQKVTLTNTGGLALVLSIAITGTDSTDFLQQNNCGKTLAAGATCTIGVVFAPTQVGPRTAAVTITNNGEGPQTVSLSGIGVLSGPNATLSPSNLIFATQLVGTTSTSQPITLTNWGTQTLQIAGGSITGDFGQTDNCHPRLAPGASCTINVTFTPKQRGTRSGILSITDNAPNSPQTVSLKGTGTVVELNPNSLDFGTVTVGQSKSLPTTLTNIGSVKLNITSIMITQDTVDFSQTNTCDGGVGAGQSCTITVTFKPTKTGPLTADVSVSDDGGGSPQLVSLSGTGGSSNCGGRCTSNLQCRLGCSCIHFVCTRRASSDLLLEAPFEPAPEFSVACAK